MKIIDIAICVDNVDPMGIGRIRFVRYNDYVGEKEKSLDYEKWDDRDQFIALPFLPSNINFIPEIGQAVKIINYDTSTETVNQEYIAGPFGTMFDYNSQTFSQQIDNTSYGVATKHKSNIRNTTGQYINVKSENTFAKEKDFGLYGKFGSDVIFTENGLQLRGGKLLSKDAASAINRETMLTYPLMAKKSSRVYLKKFPKKMTLESKKTKETTVDSKDLKTIVEYEVDSLTNPTTVKFFVYRVLKPFGQKLKTNFFNENIELPLTAVKLINSDNTSSTPTYTTSVTSVDDSYKEIRHKIFDIHEKGLKGFDETSPLFTDEDIHPFYFRPTMSFKLLSPANVTEDTNKNKILNKVKILRAGPSSGLIWSTLNASPTSQTKEVVVDYLKTDENSPEQTFSTVASDKIYFLSTDTNEAQLTINFDALDKYEYTQEDYIKNIDPNTFATVRGENLVRILYAMHNVIFTHAHNLNKPIIGQPDYPQGEELKRLIQTLENDLLNKSIRIN
jgi:hypothetical protein